MKSDDEAAAAIRAELVRTEALAQSLRTSLRLLTREEEPLPADTGTGPQGTPPNRAPRGTAHKDGVPPNKKRCSRCKTIKPRTEFSAYSAARDGLYYYCKACKAANDRATNAKRAKAKAKATRHDEDPEPVRAEGKACARCGVVREFEEFISEIDGEEVTLDCRRCRQRLKSRVRSGEAAIDSEERGRRMERISKRAKARGGIRGYARCHFVRLPQTRADQQLAHQDECGAIVFTGDEADHAADVHGLQHVTLGMFTPVVAGEDEPSGRWREKRRSKACAAAA
jgi:hypothetical protein